MSSRYVEIKSEEMAKVLSKAGFISCNEESCFEEIWGIQITPTQYYIKIFTSIDLRTGVSRENGSDAIRIRIWDSLNKEFLKVKIPKILRTQNCLTNTLDRAREAWTLVQKASRCECGGLMVERGKESKFLGCTNFPECKKTRKI